jgi:hypothetical protein
VRLERHDDCRQVRLTRAIHQPSQGDLMAAMHTVEDADRYDRTPPPGRERLETTPTLHGLSVP